MKEYDQFIKEYDIENEKITPGFILDVHNSPGQLLNETAHDQKADLILIGSKGRTMGTSIFLGSVTEKLIKMDNDIPILIVKSKEKSFDFFELIKSI